MVSRIEVIPSEVRGYGNIIEAKSLSDFVPVESDLVYSENVYSLTAVSGVYISLTSSSSSINVGSSVTLSATVVDDDEPVTGVSVSFYDGESSLGSATTNSSGVATYTTSSLTVGSHSLSATYDEKTSNSVSVTVNKLASTISLTVPASGTVGTSYTISGTLVPTSGSVKLYENGSLKDTLTVSSGSFSKAVTQNSEGTYSYYAVFEGSSTYESVTSSTGSIVVSDVPTPSYDGVSLTSDKSILSYADSESATLTAQLLDGSSSASVSGVTVEFFKGSTSLGTATTNSSGVATKTYSSAGSGDVSLTASAGTFVSETYAIEDCYYWNEDGISYTSNVTTDRKVLSGLENIVNFNPNGSSFEFSFKLQDTSIGKRLYFISVPQSTTTANYYGLGANLESNKVQIGYRTTTSSFANQTPIINPVNIKFIREGDTVKEYIEGTLKRTDTLTWIDSNAPYTLSWGIWATGTVTATNIKIKKL